MRCSREVEIAIVNIANREIGSLPAANTYGKLPYWGQSILHKYLRPAARELGIEKRFGWHTFRHTYSTLLRSVGTELKVTQELLRHSTIRPTLGVYTQAVTSAKQNA